MNTKTKAVLAFSTIFILGFGSGFIFKNVIPEPEVGVEEVGLDRDERGPDRRFDDRPPNIGQIQNHFARMLDLTNDQREPFFNRMDEYRVTLESEIIEIRNEETELLRGLYNSFRTDIATILNDDQLLKLDNEFHPDSVRFRRMRGGKP